MDKITKKYALMPCKNPLTGEQLMRPVIAGRANRTLPNVVEFAVQNNYMTGQIENLTGTVKGFFEALKQYCLEGQDVTLANWIRVRGMLTGTVGETGTLDAARNAYKIRVNALSELAVPLATFSWQRADDAGVKVTVRTVGANGGTPTGQVVKGQPIVVTGYNLYYAPDFEDAVEVSWMTDGETKTAKLTPSAAGAASMTFDWPEALANVAAGTELVFRFKLHGGVKDGPAQVCVKRAILVAE